MYLDPVEIVNDTVVTRAVITLPSQAASQFRYYTIFYRIYLSDRSLESIPQNQLGFINKALAEHYSILAPYTIDDNVPSGSIDSRFGNLNYYTLNFRDSLGDEVQSNLVPALVNPAGGKIELDFTEFNRPPFLKALTTSVEYDLFRDRIFTSTPDRLFYYTDDLANSLISNTVNTDVQPSDNVSPQHAYVSMYILAAGIDDNYTPIYSRPTHIGIFRLPDN